MVLIVAIAAATAVAAWALASYVVESGGRPARRSVATQASVLGSLTPKERQYVRAVASLSPAQLSAAFGTDQPSSVESALASLTPKERRYTRAIASMPYEQLAAAFGTGR